MYDDLIRKQPRLVYIDDINAPMPLFCGGEPLNAFNMLRQDVKDCVGYDFLGTLGDMFRVANQKVTKVGVAYYSIHKTGRAIDFDQNSKKYILVPQVINGKIYFTTWLKVEILPLARLQNMYSTGQAVKMWQGGQLRVVNLQQNKWLNFTQLAEYHKFERISAWSSWKLHYGYSTKMEFWHYQYMWNNGQRVTWQTGMDLLRQPLNSNVIPTNHFSILRYGDNDSQDGGLVTVLQKALVKKGFLRESEIDGDFRKITQGAVMAFQASVGLGSDGVVGNKTWDALDV